MIRRRYLGFAAIAVCALATVDGLDARTRTSQSRATTQPDSAAIKASPGLVGTVSKEIGATPVFAARPIEAKGAHAATV